MSLVQRYGYGSAAALCCMVLVAGCGDKPLPGQREDIAGFASAERARSTEFQPKILLPPAEPNSAWRQILSSAQNKPPHVAAELRWQKRFALSLGGGRSRSKPLQAQPILAEGKVFTLNTKGQLSAIEGKNGKILWRKRLPSSQSFGGGLAEEQGTLVIVGGSGYIAALQAEDGAVLWERLLPFALRSAPSLWEGQVLVMAADRRSLALSRESGAILWQHETAKSVEIQLTLAPAPAIAGDYVLVGYEDGTLYALERTQGRTLWQTSLVARRRTEASSDIADITAPPVIDKARVFASGFSGKTAALDLATGTPLWEIPLATLGWIALYGETLYVVDSNAVLSALDANNGRVLWEKQLQAYRDKKQRKPVVWNGPIMVNGNLIVSGSQGDILSVAAKSGTIVNRIRIKQEGFYTAPIAGGGLLYLLGKSGTLYAFE